MRAFEDRFITLGLPYRVIGGPRFYERQEIRDATAYFDVTRQPRQRSEIRAHRQHAAAWLGQIEPRNRCISLPARITCR